MFQGVDQLFLTAAGVGAAVDSWGAGYKGIGLPGFGDVGPNLGEGAGEGSTCFVAGTNVVIVVQSTEAIAIKTASDLSLQKFLLDSSIVCASLAPAGYFIYSIFERRRFLTEAAAELDLLDPVEMPLKHTGRRKTLPPSAKLPPIVQFCDVLISVASQTSCFGVRR